MLVIILTFIIIREQYDNISYNICIESYLKNHNDKITEITKYDLLLMFYYMQK